MEATRASSSAERAIREGDWAAVEPEPARTRRARNPGRGLLRNGLLSDREGAAGSASPPRLREPDPAGSGGVGAQDGSEEGGLPSRETERRPSAGWNSRNPWEARRSRPGSPYWPLRPCRADTPPRSPAAGAPASREPGGNDRTPPSMTFFLAYRLFAFRPSP